MFFKSKITFLLIFTIFICSSTSYECSIGCIDGCFANYTCIGKCKEGYYQDASCQHCLWIDPYKNSNKAYIPTNMGCQLSSSIINKTTWLPDPTTIPELPLDTDNYFHIGLSSIVDSSPCHHCQEYLFGKWFKIPKSSLPNSRVFFILSKENNIDINLSLDISSSNSFDTITYCSGHILINKTTSSSTLDFHAVDTFSDSDEKMYYIFINIEEYAEVDIKLMAKTTSITHNVTYHSFTQEDADYLSSDLTRIKSVHFPLSQEGMINYAACSPNSIFKILLFTMQFSGNYSIRIDSSNNNRVVYLQEYQIDLATHGAVCRHIWSSHQHGILGDDEGGDSLYVRIKGDENQTRYFALMTQENDVDIDLHFKAICIDSCNRESKLGICSTKKGRCRCVDGYGGDDCHLLCFYNFTWQVSDYSQLCYYGSNHCDQWCKCENGYKLEDHVCVSDICANGGMAKDEECLRGSEGCLANCQCQQDVGWVVDKKEQRCISTQCGNGKIDELYDINGYLRTEDCDSGLNCDTFCKCIDGYEPDPNQPGSCKEKVFPSWGIALIIILSIIVMIILIIILGIFIYFIMKHKTIDINIYKTQQPSYHYYINGSINTPPSKEAKYEIDPIQLDFGNDNEATTVLETRFERVEIKNHSRNKWLMIIFHTPNNPKYVFYFEPQILIIRPHTTPKVETVYMTLHCTTKIRDMKIPYTVWFSKSKSTLESIASLLKNKTFDNWTQEDQLQMDKLCKNIRRHYHHHFIITTDAASSTHIDMDELNISDNPIAEGAMGRVYIGEYRSVPVAVKQFRWENLTEEEMEELKEEVIAECEMMGKLRNPFIANYMGSVTYIPQISMVIQFFVLGSLGEYLRKEKEDYVKLPYRLKIRMLFDTARGMQFLHENRIMHLDLKPDNLLVNSLYTDSACCIKITDFGTSRMVKKTNKNEDKGLGTPIYAAPETYHDEYSYAGDVYSFAITAWEIFYQDEPYKEFKSLFDIKQYVTDGKRLGIDETMPPGLKELIQKCWKQHPIERYSFDQVTRELVKVDEDAPNHIELDNYVSDQRIEELINKRTERIQEQLKEINQD
ncbi:protein tyrosine kinase domain-containing protein [Entamoeba histolytica]|uniref:Protein tyrosine kinase domain-containing protein n=6 Tax=Entamoeba histolytica TaxID=5759 RepID=C4M423_ENTH1|nr:protein tyrosine kinase domain-containing protein [Entamoeba histolytica HM-1:IMSS]EAL46379.2 protein tyrosine kinase domain-containing protein [Entamoeba histolytica HM-1:IMSS]EMD49171.1 protein tyrosine kinase domain containing protein [Entamoeba histolytica KU27]ENY62647.1 protein tyrosine kinase domain containing protein [Entamoeba histolytica HM-1:IMSS-A]GAT96095.1 protein tyrosine kinase domain-containing protein [Entamoeba histolytica]|eukprot:XP_651765.2 protein tyrosine kinase domain-containing protein [Entamoeba histolytica HM-1:IMSS]